MLSKNMTRLSREVPTACVASNNSVTIRKAQMHLVINISMLDVCICNKSDTSLMEICVAPLMDHIKHGMKRSGRFNDVYIINKLTSLKTKNLFSSAQVKDIC